MQSDQLTETGEELAAEQRTGDVNRKEEVRRRADPAATIAGEATAGNDAMQVWVIGELSGPGMQDGGDGELCAEPFRVAPELQQRGARAVEEQVEAAVRMTTAEWTQLGRQGEDDVEVVGRQQPLLAALQPTVRGQSLAFGAMSVAAGIVRRALEAALTAHVQMATEGGSATALDVAKHAPLLDG